MWKRSSGMAEQRYDVAPQVIDPRQVDYILVCGVRVELPD